MSDCHDAGNGRACSIGVVPFAGQRGQLEQHRRGHRATGRHRVVLHILGSRNERLVIVGRIEEPTDRITKVVKDRVSQRTRGSEVVLLERGFVQRDQSIGKVGVVLEHARLKRPSILPRAAQAAFAIAHAVKQQVGRACAQLRPARLAKGRGRVGERGDHQAVPAGQDLVVARRLRPALARLEQRPTSASQAVRVAAADGPGKDRVTLPVPVVSHAVNGIELGRVRAEHCVYLRLVPGVGRAFFPVRIRIEARGKAAVCGAQLARDELQGLLRHLAVARLTGQLPRMDVDARELRVVVEHLLEVRHEPDRVRGITCEATAQVVVDAARGHRIERPARHCQRPGITVLDVQAEQELDRHGLRELR